MSDLKREVWVVEDAAGVPVDAIFDPVALSLGAHRPAVRYVPAEPEQAGKAQGWIPVSERLPVLFKLVQFVSSESGGPTFGKFNGVRWMALFDLARPGLVDYGRGQVSFWRDIPAPPTKDPTNG